MFATMFFAFSVILLPRSVAFFWIGMTWPVSSEDGLIIVWFVSFNIFCSVWFVPSDSANIETVNDVKISIDEKNRVADPINNLLYINLSFFLILFYIRIFVNMAFANFIKVVFKI